MTEERMQSDGAIFTNNYKDNEKQPDWTGKVVLDKKATEVFGRES
jgi:hypothetical protein